MSNSMGISSHGLLPAAEKKGQERMVDVWLGVGPRYGSWTLLEVEKRIWTCSSHCPSVFPLLPLSLFLRGHELSSRMCITAPR